MQLVQLKLAYKGSDIGSIIWATEEFTRFYHPRRDKWSTHFQLQQDLIQPISSVGEVTTRILGLNDQSRVLEKMQRTDRRRDFFLQ